MSTVRQIEANRRNSQLSTGPRTPEGKGVSRFNALKSGINAKAQIIPGEDPAELEAITTGYHCDWAPATYLERFLVDSLVRADWLLQRLSRLEAELWVHQIEDARKLPYSKLDEEAPIGDIYSRNYERFTRLQRRIDSTERSYYRALTQLQRLKVTPAILSPAEGPSRTLSSAQSSDTEPSTPPVSPTPAEPAGELASFCPPSPATSEALCFLRKIPTARPDRSRPGIIFECRGADPGYASDPSRCLPSREHLSKARPAFRPVC